MAPGRLVANVVSWFVINKEAPFAPEGRRLRVRANYSDGSARLLQAAFRDRASLDKYIARFHPEYSGKEVDPPPAPEPTGPTQP